MNSEDKLTKASGETEKENDEQYQKMSSSKEILASLNQKIIKCSEHTMNLSGRILDGILTNDYELIKEICVRGFPDDLPMLRALMWKINLGYLPSESELWGEILIDRRKKYHYYKEKFMKMKVDEYNDKTFKNRELLEVITKDVNRTHIQFNFFFQPTSKNKKFTSQELQNILKERQNCAMNNMEKIYKLDSIETHAEVIERILFIYSKLRPDVSYKQGMNEIIAPIYYCLSYDKTYLEETEENIEADTFWTFFNVMEDLITSFDDNSNYSTFKKADIMAEAFSKIDNELTEHFKKIGLEFGYFCTRWFILLFSQDFMVSDILRLWDIFFMEKNKFYYVFYAGLSIIELKREKLMEMDMVNCMMELQHLEDIDLEMMIKEMMKLKEKYDNDIGYLFQPPEGEYY